MEKQTEPAVIKGSAPDEGKIPALETEVSPVSVESPPAAVSPRPEIPAEQASPVQNSPEEPEVTRDAPPVPGSPPTGPIKEKTPDASKIKGSGPENRE
jgi:hypothetical protein